MENKKWVKDGDTINYDNIPQVLDKLESGIYELNASKFGFYLTVVSESFILPDKIYSNEEEFIKRVETTFHGFNKNFGILLKGLKGTGKTLTAKQICNRLKLPVILVNEHFDDIGNFINSINQDVILFFDEFEKTYDFSEYFDPDGKGEKKSIANLLTLMDGVFTSDYKRLFILTTNKEYLPDAILSRPSRVRYSKDFTDLSLDSINMILNDSVKNKELIPNIIDLLKELEIVTVDIVKSFAEEANLYNKVDSEFFSIFNVKKIDEKLSLVSDKGDILVENFNSINARIGNTIYLDDDSCYYVLRKNSKTELEIVRRTNWNGINHVYTKDKIEKVKIVKTQKIHRSFHSELVL